MIHDGSDGYFGDSKSYQAWAKWSGEIRQRMYEIFYEKMIKKHKKITLKQIEQMCSHDSIFNAKQAIKIGLADKIL